MMIGVGVVLGVGGRVEVTSGGLVTPDVAVGVRGTPHSPEAEPVLHPTVDDTTNKSMAKSLALIFLFMMVVIIS